MHNLSNNEIKDFITVFLKTQVNKLDAQEIWDYVNDPKISIDFIGVDQKVKEVELGKETIPSIGFKEVINNEFWDLQDPFYKKLFPELAESQENFEFLLILIYDIKYNKKTGKVEIHEERYKFSAPKK